MSELDLDALKRDESLLRHALEQAGVTRWTGRNCRCPMHDDRNPSAGIHLDKDGASWLFTCHGCGFAGSVLQVWAHTANRAVADLIRDIRETGALPDGSPVHELRPSRRPKPDPRREADRRERMDAAARRSRKARRADVMQAWADRLNTTVATLDRYRCGLDGAWLTCPMRDGNLDVIGVRKRAESGTYRCENGSNNGLFAPGDVSCDGGCWLLPEGMSDTLSLASLGWGGSNAVIGRPSANGGEDLVLDAVRRLGPEACVVIADNDKSGTGRAGATKLANRIVATGLVPVVKVIRPPSPHKDVRQWVAAGATKEDVRAAVRAAVPLKGGVA